MSLPRFVQVSQTQRWPVRQVKCVPGNAKALGAFDPKAECIWIKRGQPEVGKHVVLLHELIHAVEQHCVDAKLFRRSKNSEALVKNMAGGLLPMLALSGLWPRLSAKAVRRFYRVIPAGETED